jgi:hypothetical protein
MNTTLRSVISLLLFLLLPIAQTPLPAQPTSSDASGPVTLSESDLEQLVAPIALYPDPLIALILPASTVPTDIVLASRFLNNGGSADDIDAQPWDQNVKGLAHYPDVLQMMDDNLDWTNQLGAAVIAQQADVMNAIQTMRAKAQSLGNLESTPQQQVVSTNNVIQIVPADPQVIYVPYYNPQVVYVQAPPPAAPFVTFSAGLAIGIWLGGGCNWNNHGFYYGNFYRPGYGWGYNNVTIVNNNYNYWRPNPNRPPPRPPYRPGGPGKPPGWKPPPNWGKPGGPGNRPGNPNNPGNRPGIPGKPGQPGGPGGGPNRPGGPGGNKPPTIQPVPSKPSTRPNQPGGPGKPGGGKPSIQPVPETKPAPRPQKPAPSQPSIQPAPNKPSTRPAPSKPGGIPSIQPHPGFNAGKPASKPNHSAPAARPQQQPRGGGGGAGPSRGGGGGGQRGGPSTQGR